MYHGDSGISDLITATPPGDHRRRLRADLQITSCAQAMIGRAVDVWTQDRSVALDGSDVSRGPRSGEPKCTRGKVYFLEPRICSLA
jgi:hypothetical protein